MGPREGLRWGLAILSQTERHVFPDLRQMQEARSPPAGVAERHRVPSQRGSALADRATGELAARPKENQRKQIAAVRDLLV